MPPSVPVCAASLRPSTPQAMQGISRIHAKYVLSRGGPFRVGEVARRCGLRPWIAQARYERSWWSDPKLDGLPGLLAISLTRWKFQSRSEPWAKCNDSHRDDYDRFRRHRRVRATSPRNCADVELRDHFLFAWPIGRL